MKNQFQNKTLSIYEKNQYEHFEIDNLQKEHNNNRINFNNKY